MRTVEIDHEVLESMFQHVEYLHELVVSVAALLNAKQSDDWLTSKEAAEILRISKATLQNLKMYGKIPFSQIEGRTMYLAEDIGKYLTTNKKSPPT